MNRIIIAMALMVFSKCSQGDTPPSSTIKKFNLPVIIQKQTTDTLHFFEEHYLWGNRNYLIGKSAFSDSLLLDESASNIYSTYEKDIIGDNHLVEYSDSSLISGLTLIADYNTIVRHQYPELSSKSELSQYFYAYYPVYIINETSQLKVFISKVDAPLTSIQEAQNEEEANKWRPIDTHAFESCSQGDFGLKLYPGEFAVYLLPRYKGSEIATMRVRLQNGNSIYLSPPFQGIINTSQFTMRDSQVEYIMGRNNRRMSKAFLGAIPKGYDSLSIK